MYTHTLHGVYKSCLVYDEGLKRDMNLFRMQCCFDFKITKEL